MKRIRGKVGTRWYASNQLNQERSRIRLARMIGEIWLQITEMNDLIVGSDSRLASFTSKKQLILEYVISRVERLACLSLLLHYARRNDFKMFQFITSIKSAH